MSWLRECFKTLPSYPPSVENVQPTRNCAPQAEVASEASPQPPPQIIRLQAELEPPPVIEIEVEAPPVVEVMFSLLWRRILHLKVSSAVDIVTAKQAE